MSTKTTRSKQWKSNQNINDQANNITEYLIARNKSTEIIDVDN